MDGVVGGANFGSLLGIENKAKDTLLLLAGGAAACPTNSKFALGWRGEYLGRFGIVVVAGRRERTGGREAAGKGRLDRLRGKDVV